VLTGPGAAALNNGALTGATAGESTGEAGVVTDEVGVAVVAGLLGAVAV